MSAAEAYTEALVVGAGPAGLMAADVLSAAGHRVLIADQKPSFGRKFLMAGKSGLNLTKDEPLAPFLRHYDSDWLVPMVTAFGPEAVQDWARALGQDLFVGSTGRVFPEVMKASPLLRAWLARLRAQGVEMQTRWRFDGFNGQKARFHTPEGLREVAAEVTVLALGGGSWARLGSDGLWAQHTDFEAHVTPFLPSNTGLRIDWTPHMRPHFGTPIKAVQWHVLGADGARLHSSRGETVISAQGLEGGGIYPLIPALRDPDSRLILDLAPDLSVEALRAKLGSGKKSLSQQLRAKLRWPPQKVALFQEMRPRDGTAQASDSVDVIKALPIAQLGPRPLDEAISTAGGVRRDAVTEDLELRDRPGVYVCGEMLDWDAPTGGYLLTACLATGRWTGLAATRRLSP